MKSNYKKIGEYIQEVNVRNSELQAKTLFGINIDKYYMPSVANIVGTDMTAYKVVKHGQFACNRMHVGRDFRLPVALSGSEEEFIVSPAYDVFEIIDKNILLPEYLMMWFSRKEFDRNAWFYTDADVRGGLPWKSFCEMELPIPHPDKQKEIVKEYNTIVNRMALNNQLIKKLEETAQAIYKQWFVDFDNGSDEKVELGKYLIINPSLSIRKDDLINYVEMNDLSTDNMCVNNFVQRPFTAGSKFQNNDILLARITPCLENGKTGFVNFLNENEIAFGSTEFIVMRARKDVSPFWVYCLAKDEDFRSYAISSMVGSSGRERVHEDYLRHYLIKELNYKHIANFHDLVKPFFEMIRSKNNQNQNLEKAKNILLSKLATIEN